MKRINLATIILVLSIFTGTVYADITLQSKEK